MVCCGHVYGARGALGIIVDPKEKVMPERVDFGQDSELCNNSNTFYQKHFENVKKYA